MKQRQVSCTKLKMQYLTNANKLGTPSGGAGALRCHLINAVVSRVLVRLCQISLSKFILLAIN